MRCTRWLEQAVQPDRLMLQICLSQPLQGWNSIRHAGWIQEVIEKDGALEERFQKSWLSQQTLSKRLSGTYKRKIWRAPQCSIYGGSLISCISLSQKIYIWQVLAWCKAIDIMDEAGSRAHIKTLKVPKKCDWYRGGYFCSRKRRQNGAAQDFKKAAVYRDILRARKIEESQGKWFAQAG